MMEMEVMMEETTRMGGNLSLLVDRNWMILKKI